MFRLSSKEGEMTPVPAQRMNAAIAQHPPVALGNDLNTWLDYIARRVK
jgi:hypothetical protein